MEYDSELNRQFNVDSKKIFRNYSDEETRKLLKNLKICFKCRNYFRVWPSACDERILEESNPNFESKGGGDRRSSHRIMNALNFKTRRGFDLSINEVEPEPIAVRDADQMEDAVDPSERSFHIGPEDEDGFQDPNDINVEEDGSHSDGNNSDDDNNDQEPYDSDDDSSSDANDDGNNQDGNNQDGNNQDGDNADNPPSIESIGEPLLMDSAFMNGKILFLPVTDGNQEPALCAICHQIADEDSETITALLENRLRLNPIISESLDSFGIAFDYYNSDADFQIICGDCLMTSSESNEGQTVYPKVFSLDFHKRFGNLSIDHPDNIQDLFSHSSSTVSYACVRELRSRILELEKEIA